LALSLGAIPVQAFDHWTTGLNRYQPIDKDAKYYAAHARPERSAPRAAANGSWLVETDKNTGLAEPRLHSLANGRGVTRANHALQAVHGHILQLEGAWRHEQHIGSHAPAVAAGSLMVHICLQPRSAMSCAENGPFFKFGGLLTVCDTARLRIFRDLWKEQAEALQATISRRADKWDEWCRSLATFWIDIQDGQLGHNFGFEFSLYLTPDGLAILSRSMKAASRP
jgi:hypothetical protein